MKDHITTYTGVEFCPSRPQSDGIVIEDIAHALSMMCRGNGHIQYFYSVAQHSINCALEASARAFSPRVQLACLLHDASEAYLADITRPVKPLLPDYLRMEKQLQNLIFDKYIGALSSEELTLVRQMDDEILWNEFHFLMNKTDLPRVPLKATDLFLEEQEYRKIKDMFLELFWQLKENV